MQQLHKRITEDQVKFIFDKYLLKELSAKRAQEYLKIGRSRFFLLVALYKNNKDTFSINYTRSYATRKLDEKIEVNILKELQFEKEKIIDNPDVPTKNFNYSYLKDEIKRKYDQDVSVPTIINRSKRHGYYKKKKQKKVHDREVITNFAGEMLQRDSSHHLWSPYAENKWYLIDDLDDYSRYILYADFWPRETSFTHILALEHTISKCGIPNSYYVDQHAIFRYIKNRDKNSPWREYSKFTGDVVTQWEQVLKDCKTEPIFALSPQAKGKIERPYRWLQDRVVRTCAREGIKTIEDAREVLRYEVEQYNTKRVHSTTNEIPIIRFERALKEKRSMFRDFKLEDPFKSSKDIFCIRINRVVDSYRNISINKLKLKVPKVMPRQTVQLRIIPDLKTNITEVRFWHKNQYVGSQKVKTEDLPIVQF